MELIVEGIKFVVYQYDERVFADAVDLNISFMSAMLPDYLIDMINKGMGNAKLIFIGGHTKMLFFNENKDFSVRLEHPEAISFRDLSNLLPPLLGKESTSHIVTPHLAEYKKLLEASKETAEYETYMQRLAIVKPGHKESSIEELRTINAKLTEIIIEKLKTIIAKMEDTILENLQTNNAKAEEYIKEFSTNSTRTDALISAYISMLAASSHIKKVRESLAMYYPQMFSSSADSEGSASASASSSAEGLASASVSPSTNSKSDILPGKTPNANDEILEFTKKCLRSFGLDPDDNVIAKALSAVSSTSSSVSSSSVEKSSPPVENT